MTSSREKALEVALQRALAVWCPEHPGGDGADGETYACAQAALAVPAAVPATTSERERALVVAGAQYGEPTAEDPKWGNADAIIAEVDKTHPRPAADRQLATLMDLVRSYVVAEAAWRQCCGTDDEIAALDRVAVSAFDALNADISNLDAAARVHDERVAAEALQRWRQAHGFAEADEVTVITERMRALFDSAKNRATMDSFHAEAIAAAREEGRAESDGIARSFFAANIADPPHAHRMPTWAPEFGEFMRTTIERARGEGRREGVYETCEAIGATSSKLMSSEDLAIEQAAKYVATIREEGREEVRRALHEVITERVLDVANRLIAAGPKAAHVSASECHELTDAVWSARNLR